MTSPGWKRSLNALWLANFVAATGMMAMVPFLTFFVEDLGVRDAEVRNRWAGILVGAAPIAAALLGPVWGSVGDRYGRRAMIIRALLGIVIFVGLMTWATTLGQMLVLRLLQGCFSGFVPPSLALASLLAPDAARGRVTSRIQSAIPAGAVAGYFMGGLVNKMGDMRAIFPVCAALALAAIGIVLARVEEVAPTLARGPEERPPVFRRLLDDYRYVLKVPALARFLAILVGLRIVTSFVDPSLARYVLDLGGDELDAGLTLSCEAAVVLVAMPLWGRASDRIGHRRCFALCAAGLAVSWLGQSFAGSVPALLGARLVNGLFIAGVLPAGYGLAARETAPERRGSAMGVAFLCVALSHALGAMAGGSFLNLVGFRPLMRGIAAAALVFGALAWAESRRARRAAPDRA